MASMLLLSLFQFLLLAAGAAHAFQNTAPSMSRPPHLILWKRTNAMVRLAPQRLRLLERSMVPPTDNTADKEEDPPLSSATADNNSGSTNEPDASSGSAFRSFAMDVAHYGDEGDADEEDDVGSEAVVELLDDVAEQFTWTDKVKAYFKTPNDGLTAKQRMAKMGLAAALSYGWVSNMSYSVSVSLAWYISSCQTGLSPLAPGQWKKFLAVYAGFFVFNNIVRPIRLAVSVTISPQFDKIINAVQKSLKISKGKAIFIVVFMGNVVGTCLFMGLGIALASLAAGVPIFRSPPPPPPAAKGIGAVFARLLRRRTVV